MSYGDFLCAVESHRATEIDTSTISIADVYPATQRNASAMHLKSIRFHLSRYRASDLSANAPLPFRESAMASFDGSSIV